MKDTLKFHVYADGLLVLVASGFLPMETVARALSDPSYRCHFTLQSNFQAVEVDMQLDPCASPAMDLQLPKMERSSLRDSQMYSALFGTFAGTVRTILGQTTEINPKKGAPMFANVLTAHNFQGELTTHVHFHTDMEPTPRDSELFFLSGLTLLAAAEGLHVQGVEAEEVLQWEVGSRQFTEYCAAVCQAYMRSAHICPYLSDFNISGSLDAMGRMQMELGESFRLPFREPFKGSAKQATFLNADDCDGQATFMMCLLHSFMHMHDDHSSNGITLLGSGANSARRYLPDHLFNMSDSEKDTLVAIGLKIGKAVKEGIIKCDITLVSAGGASFGDDDSNIGGHATCVLSNWANKNEPFDIMMEGTNSIYSDPDMREITINGQNGLKGIPIIDIANLLTRQINGEVDRANNRLMQHINLNTHSVFYKTAFCQNGVLLATPMGPENANLSYGVNMVDISNYDKKVLMPIDASMLDSAVKAEGAHATLQKYCKERRDEIHPPLVPLERVIEATKAWSPMELFKLPDAIRGRPTKTCLASTSERDPLKRADILKAAQASAKKWNDGPHERAIGHQRVVSAFDSVYKILNFYTDDMTVLQQGISAPN
jgi:hypothetical protein